MHLQKRPELQPDAWSAQERTARETLAKEVHAMAAASPQITPDHAFYEKMFNLLIEYDDWRGVQAAKSISVEGGVEINPELIGRIDAYLADAEKRSYHQNRKDSSPVRLLWQLWFARDTYFARNFFGVFGTMFVGHRDAMLPRGLYGNLSCHFMTMGDGYILANFVVDFFQDFMAMDLGYLFAMRNGNLFGGLDGDFAAHGFGDHAAKRCRGGLCVAVMMSVVGFSVSLG